MPTPQEIVNELVLQTVTGTVTWEISAPFWVSKRNGAAFFVNHGDGTLTYVAGPGYALNRLVAAAENWPLYDLLAETYPVRELTDEEARRHAMDVLAETATGEIPNFMLPKTHEWERSDLARRILQPDVPDDVSLSTGIREPDEAPEQEKQ